LSNREREKNMLIKRKEGSEMVNGRKILKLLLVPVHKKIDI
jgi:hypothetical protein